MSCSFPPLSAGPLLLGDSFLSWRQLLFFSRSSQSFWELYVVIISARVWRAIVSTFPPSFNYLWLNFSAVNSQQPLAETDFPKGSDIEKVAFPSSEGPLPTYISFEKPDPRVMGPRFSNKSAEPFETSVHKLALPLPTLQRNLNDVQVHRNDSYGSTKSHGSSSSQDSFYSDDSHVGNKRWIIE